MVERKLSPVLLKQKKIFPVIMHIRGIWRLFGPNHFLPPLYLFTIPFPAHPLDLSHLCSITLPGLHPYTEQAFRNGLYRKRCIFIMIYTNNKGRKKKGREKTKEDGRGRGRKGCFRHLIFVDEPSTVAAGSLILNSFSL